MRIMKEASSFGDLVLARFFPLSQDDEDLLIVLEVDQEVTEYIQSTTQPDWDLAKPAQATK